METIFLLMAQEEFWLMPSFPERTGRERFTLTMMSLGQWATVWVSENPGSLGALHCKKYYSILFKKCLCFFVIICDI